MSKERLAVLAGTTAAAAVLVSVAALAQTPTSGAAASAAYGVSADFTGGGMGTALGPVAPVSGTAPPAYARTKVVPSFSGSVAIPPLVPSSAIFPMVAALTVDATQLVSHVASPGFGVDDIAATGDSTIDHATLVIANPPPPPGSGIPVGPPFLTVAATGVAAAANYDRVLPTGGSVDGSASFTALSISGTLLGGGTISYSGAAAPNTVLYQSATITITVDQQIRAVLVPCPPCVAPPADIVVHALDISFNNAVIDGRAFSGTIVLGAASAGQ